jgi:phospholipase C
MKSNLKKIILIFLFILLLLIGGSILLYHHYTDYDSAAILFNSNMPIGSQKAKTVFSLSPIHHVFIIVEENHDWQNIYNNTDAPYINNTLLTQGGFATDYHNVDKHLNELHPSEPNYIMLEAGRIAFPDYTFTTDKLPGTKNSTSSHNHLAYLLDKSGYSWKSYQEDISGIDCPINAINNYAPKHNPFVYFQDVSGNPPGNTNIYCQKHVRPLSELQRDLQTDTIANYTFITPNLQHDMHDGTIAQADTWLSQVVPIITNSKIFKKDGALFITWDEGNEGTDENNPIGMIIESPFAKKNYHNSTSYTHASLVKTIEEVFHLSPLLGFADNTTTTDLSDFFIKIK